MKNINNLDKICEYISSREVLSSKAERESIKLKQVEFLENQIGCVFESVITGITKWGIYAEIIDNKCEGLISYSSDMIPDIEQFLVSTKNGVIRLGDVIKISVKSVDIDKKQINFSLV